MNEKLRILLTNDDGIYAHGLHTLCSILQKKSNIELYIAAPAKNNSGVGMAFSFMTDVHVDNHKWSSSDVKAWAIHGTPVDCVKLATEELLSDVNIDFIFSGINHGSNAGRNVLYSGTVGAAIEGCVKGIPSIAISYAHSNCSEMKGIDVESLSGHIFKLLDYLIKNPLPKHQGLNVNIPHGKCMGIKFTTQGYEVCTAKIHKVHELDDRTSYKIGDFGFLREDMPSEEEHFLSNGFITIVPINTFNKSCSKDNLEVMASSFSEHVKNNFEDS